MPKIELMPGDIFCTANPMWLGRAINFVQKLNSKDNESTYSHAGVILYGGWEKTSMVGTRIMKCEHESIDLHDAITFEALWTNKRQKLFENYVGKQILIGRHVDMTPKKALKGWQLVRKHEGKWYAGHRLVFFCIPMLAKFINLGLGVCSEYTMEFLCGANVKTVWKGWNPDDVADMIRKHKDWEIVFEGKLE